METLNGEQLAMLAAAAQVASLDSTLKSKLLALAPLTKPPQRNNNNNNHHHQNNRNNLNKANEQATRDQLFPGQKPDQRKITQRDCSINKQPLTKNRLNSSTFGETLTNQATHVRNGPSTHMAARVLDQLPELIDSFVRIPHSSMFGPLSMSSGSSSASPNSISYGSSASGESADDLSSDGRRASTSSSTQVSSTSRQTVGFESTLAASLDKRARKKDQNRRAAYNYRRKKTEERNRIREEEGRLVHIQVRLQGKIARLEERLLILLGTNTRRISNTVGCSICFQCPLCLQSCDNIMNLRNHLRLVHYPSLTTNAWNNNRSRDPQVQLEPKQPFGEYQRIFQNELINCNDGDNHHNNNNSYGDNNINNNNDDDLKFVNNNNNIIVDYISNVS